MYLCLPERSCLLIFMHDEFDCNKNANYSGFDNAKLPLSSGVYLAIGITMSVLFIFALTENILVLLVYKRTKKNFTPGQIIGLCPWFL